MLFLQEVEFLSSSVFRGSDACWLHYSLRLNYFRRERKCARFVPSCLHQIEGKPLVARHSPSTSIRIGGIDQKFSRANRSGRIVPVLHLKECQKKRNYSGTRISSRLGLEKLSRPEYDEEDGMDNRFGIRQRAAGHTAAISVC